MTAHAEIAPISVQLPSGTVSYREAGSGHPLILLHGSGPGATGWSNFRPNVATLAQQYRVIVPDMPGWGASSEVTFVERNHPVTLRELVDALDLERVAVIGNSMGGGTSISFAVENPDRVSHVITMGAGAAGTSLFTPAGGPSEGLRALRAAYVDPTPTTMRHLVDVMTFDPAFATEALVQERLATALSHPTHLANFAESMTRGRRTAATPEAIAGIEVPVLAIHGRDDRVVSYESSLRLVSLVANARLVLLNRCGHWAQLEHADEFNRLVADFIAHN